MQTGAGYDSVAADELSADAKREDGRRVNELWGRHHLGRVTISGYGVRVRGEGCVRAGEQAGGAGGAGGRRQRLARFVWGERVVMQFKH